MIYNYFVILFGYQFVKLFSLKQLASEEIDGV